MKGLPDRMAGFSQAPAENGFRGFSSRKTPLYGRLPSRERLTPRGSGTPQCGRIAQLVEQLTLNQRVLGSNPSASTKLLKDLGQSIHPYQRGVEARLITT